MQKVFAKILKTTISPKPKSKTHSREDCEEKQEGH